MGVGGHLLVLYSLWNLHYIGFMSFLSLTGVHSSRSQRSQSAPELCFPCNPALHVTWNFLHRSCPKRASCPPASTRYPHSSSSQDKSELLGKASPSKTHGGPGMLSSLQKAPPAQGQAGSCCDLRSGSWQSQHCSHLFCCLAQKLKSIKGVHQPQLAGKTKH